MLESESPAVSKSGWIQRRLVGVQSLKFQETTLGILLILPLLVVLIGLMAYPIGSAIYTSMLSKLSGGTGEFIGLDNYVTIVTEDRVIGVVLFNTIAYTVSAVVVKTLFGFIVAFVLNESIRGRGLFRAWILLPWMTPALVIGLVWRWMFDQTGGIINYVLLELNLVEIPPAWLANAILARVAVVIANVWRGFPFFTVMLLAGMQTISAELYEAAEMDGASIWQRIWYVTIPSVRPVLYVVVILSTIWTFNDFVLIWWLTRGGPGYSTQIFSTYSYHLGFMGSRIGYATAVSLVAMPLVIAFVVALLPQLWEDEE